VANNSHPFINTHNTSISSILYKLSVLLSLKLYHSFSANLYILLITSFIFSSLILSNDIVISSTNTDISCFNHFNSLNIKVFKFLKNFNVQYIANLEDVLNHLATTLSHSFFISLPLGIHHKLAIIFADFSFAIPVIIKEDTTLSYVTCSK
jgi:hypothetical protein